MPVDYVVDESRQLVVWTATGATTDAEWRACEERSRQDPRCLAIPRVLVDVSANESVLSRSYVTGLVGRLLADPHPPGSRWAIVVSQDVSAGVSHQVGGFLGSIGVDVRVFREREEAERWLEASR